MLASNVNLLVRVTHGDNAKRKLFGYARLRLGRVGEGEFRLTGEVKESEYITVQDQLLGYITVDFKVGGLGKNCFCILSPIDIFVWLLLTMYSYMIIAVGICMAESPCCVYKFYILSRSL